MSNEALTDELSALFDAAGKLQFNHRVHEAQLSQVNLRIDALLAQQAKEHEEQKAKEQAADVAGA